MDPFSLSHLSDQDVLRGLKAAVAKERALDDALLADAVEIEARGLELPADVKERVEELREERAGEPFDTAATLRLIAPGLYELQIEVDLETYEKFLYARALLGAKVPGGDLREVFRRAVQSLAESLERGEDPALK